MVYQILFPLLLAACASLTTPVPSDSPVPLPNPTASPLPTPTPSPTASPPAGGRKQVLQGWIPEYSEYVVQAILARYPKLLQIEDARIKDYCPAYLKMLPLQRAQFFVDFMAALTVPESSTHRAMIYVETTMSTDKVTGYQVRSEGLFQLSYQDKNSYGKACDFDWPSDAKKAREDYDSKKKYGDGSRNIHDAYRNIECTLSIFEQHLFKYSKTARFQDALDDYWWVLKRGSEEQREAYHAVRKALQVRTSACASPNYM